MGRTELPCPWPFTCDLPPLPPFRLAWRKSQDEELAASVGIFPEADQDYKSCARSSVQSYLPWETASQGLTLHNPIPPISHCITGSG